MINPTWTELVPGVYDDNAGGIHLDMAVLLTSHGYADTPANRATLVQAWRDLFPQIPIVMVDDEHPHDR